MKIFELVYKDGEQQWVAANTNIEALEKVLSIGDCDLSVMMEISELPEEKWDEYHVVNTDYDEADPEDWERVTFREFLNKISTPEIISATFYDV
jgi:hypothetical protein